MRHTVHLMLGDRSERVLKDIKRYVVKYGSEEENMFFNAMLYREEAEGANFYNSLLEQGDKTTFVSGIDDRYEVVLDRFYSVPKSNRQEYLQGCFADLYNRKITINNSGDSPSLHVCFYVPVYEAKYAERVEEFLQAIESIPQQYEADLFLLPYDLAFLIEDEQESLPVKMAQYQIQTKQSIQFLLGLKNRFRSIGNLILMQNCNSNGLSLNLDEDSFVRIIGEFALLTVSHYNEMFNITARDPKRPIHALGLSVLSFDKYYFVQYLLHKAYMHILDREQVCLTEVDVNKVSKTVQDILTRNVNVFSRFYDEQVKTRLEKKLDQETIMAQIRPELMREIARLTEECQAYLDEPTVSLPEKKATLAQLLGEDDDLLVGYMFNKKQLVIDDCSREVLDFFVDANNRLYRLKEDVFDTDTAMEQVRKARHNEIADYAVLSRMSGAEEEMPSDILRALKNVKIKMRESSNYIRLKTGELEAMDAQMQEREQSQRRLTDSGFVYEDDPYHLQLDEIVQPIEEDNRPKLTELIDEAKHRLREQEQELQKIEEMYNRVFQALGNNGNRTAITEGTIERLQMEREQHQEKKSSLQKERSRVLREKRKTIVANRIGFGIGAALVITVYLILIFKGHLSFASLFLNAGAWYNYAIYLLYTAIFIYTDWKNRREYRRHNEDYMDRITKEEQTIQHLTAELDVIRLKSHIAGMIIDSLAKLFYNLHSKYNGMRSYVGNLKAWREEEQTESVMCADVRDPFLTLVNNRCLDRYFEACKERITQDIRLYAMFRDTYKVDDESVIRFMNGLKEHLIRALFCMLDDFSIYKHIVGEGCYEFVERDYTNLDLLLQQMDSKSMHFVRTLSSVETKEALNAGCKILFMNADFETERARWKALCDKNFQVSPMLCKDGSAYKVTLLQLNALTTDQIALLH